MLSVPLVEEPQLYPPLPTYTNSPEVPPRKPGAGCRKKRVKKNPRSRAVKRPRVKNAEPEKERLPDPLQGRRRQITQIPLPVKLPLRIDQNRVRHVLDMERPIDPSVRIRADKITFAVPRPERIQRRCRYASGQHHDLNPPIPIPVPVLNLSQFWEKTSRRSIVRRIKLDQHRSLRPRRQCAPCHPFEIRHPRTDDQFLRPRRHRAAAEHQTK